MSLLEMWIRKNLTLPSLIKFVEYFVFRDFKKNRYPRSI